MKKLLTCAFLLPCIAILFSCKEGSKSVFIPSASGEPYEMLVVMDDSAWERPAGRALFNVLDTDVPGLPQSERSFRIIQIDDSEFSRTFSLLRNVIIPDINKIYTQTKFKFSRDVHAAPQMIMTIQSPNEEEFAAYLAKHKQVIIDFFTRVEMNRQVKYLEGKHSKLIDDLVRDMFGCHIAVPTELAYYKRGENFLWATTNRESDDLNVVVYSYPFTDTDTFTEEYFLQKRDSFMKANLPGPIDGSYMATDKNFVYTKDISVRGRYAMEVKGLWAMNGAVMGGPYVSHVRVDEQNGRVIVSEAFVYSPQKKKRDTMRKMEAALYTLTLPDENKDEELPIEVVGTETDEEKQ